MSLSNNTNIEQEFFKRIKESQGVIHKVSRMYCDNEEHRKDLFQEMLIQLWKSYPSFRGDSKFSTWMYRVAINVAIQDLRKTKKKQQLFFQTNQFKDISEETKSEVQNEKLNIANRYYDKEYPLNSTYKFGSGIGSPPVYINVTGSILYIRTKFSNN